MRTSQLRPLCLITTIVLSSVSAFAAANGQVRFAQRQNSAFDVYTNNPSPTALNWLITHFTSMMEYSPYFDKKVSSYPGVVIQLYQDSMAVYNPSTTATQNPSWILKTASGANVYLNYGCGGGTCPQFAADVSNPAYRANWIAIASNAVAANGYKGIWIDDVNFDFRFSDGNGNSVTPIDPNTGGPLTVQNWRSYFAAFLQQIRTALPNTELLHNSIWYAANSLTDPYIKQEIQSANFINREGGFTDPGLTGGTGTYSVFALMNFIDYVHSLGSNIVIDDFGDTPVAEQYALAGYFLITNGVDRIGNQSMTPDNWWSGYQTDLGAPVNARYKWNNLWRRDFANGFVLLNEPQAATVTVPISGSYKNLSGSAVSSVTLPASQAVILLGTGTTAPTTPSSPTTPAQGSSVMSVNTGGVSYTDAAGTTWAADTGFSGGTTWSNANSNVPVEYQSLRFGNSFQYNFAVPNGTHAVTLKFAELYYTRTNQRLFSVSINGTQVLNQFDILAAAGGASKTVDKTFSVPVTNGSILIQFSQGSADLPQINAIQIQ